MLGKSIVAREVKVGDNILVFTFELSSFLVWGLHQQYSGAIPSSLLREPCSPEESGFLH